MCHMPGAAILSIIRYSLATRPKEKGPPLMPTGCQFAAEGRARQRAMRGRCTGAVSLIHRQENTHYRNATYPSYVALIADFHG
jgi:hypothetical protein